MGFPFLGKTSPDAEIDTPGVSNLRHMLAGIGGIFGANMGIIRYAYRFILYCMRHEVSFLAEYISLQEVLFTHKNLTSFLPPKTLKGS